MLGLLGARRWHYKRELRCRRRSDTRKLPVKFQKSGFLWCKLWNVKVSSDLGYPGGAFGDTYSGAWGAYDARGPTRR
uniref:Uncharacterized protein n=1 Tax=Nelumbo nucifera TaxID=4432 RepID=A0A822YH52_NELNU|nr:TPA_asm: hypothetical protein HUJ06_010623 [Nelumbo nucifera]